MMNIPFEEPGYIAVWMDQQGHSVQVWRLFENPALPDIEDVDLLVIMGGSMNIYEEERYPYLAGEKELIHACIKEHEILSVIPGTFPPFRWHGETFDLPEGARLLGSSAACRNQGFLYGDHALALQFHLEITPQIVDGLLQHASDDLTAGQYVQSAREIWEGLKNCPANKEILFHLLDRVLGPVQKNQQP
jgi:GMP synthase (glutamine-hydrolysing)